MSQQNNPGLTEEQIEKLESLYPKLCDLFSTLEPFVSERILNELGEIKNIVHDVFYEQSTHDEDFEQVYNKLREIADEQNFISIWSVDEVGPEDMDTPFSNDSVLSITYESHGETQVINFDGEGQQFTWLAAWKYADQLIRQSQDTYHVFIENFKEGYRGHYSLVTGS